MAGVDDLEVAIAAAEAGAAVVRARFATELSLVMKGAFDFATDVDLAAERAILAVVRAARPDDEVLAEETGRSGAAGSSRRWLIDPLCGTVNYAAGTPLVAVNVALSVAGRLATAAVADPIAGELFWTDGSASYLQRAGHVTRLRPDARLRLVDLNLDPPFPSAPGFRAVALAGDPGFAALFRPRVLSTSLALTWVAAGRRAAYVSDGHPWDSVHFAAGIALCRDAGCVVSDLRRGARGQGQCRAHRGRRPRDPPGPPRPGSRPTRPRRLTKPAHTGPAPSRPGACCGLVSRLVASLLAPQPTSDGPANLGSAAGAGRPRRTRTRWLSCERSEPRNQPTWGLPWAALDWRSRGCPRGWPGSSGGRARVRA